MGNLLQMLQVFGEEEKDLINEETIELMAPYLEVKFRDDPERNVFSGEVAKGSSHALKGMCDWCGAMSAYHKASKVVKPKLKLLQVKAAELKVAED
jgi:dynein heavy chain